MEFGTATTTSVLATIKVENVSSFVHNYWISITLASTVTVASWLLHPLQLLLFLSLQMQLLNTTILSIAVAMATILESHLYLQYHHEMCMLIVLFYVC